MTQFTCPQCGNSHHLKSIRKRVFCSCGGVAHNPDWIGKPISLYGPGDAMGEITKELGIPEKTGCGCNQLAAKMNALGIDGCEQRRDWIIQQLKANAEKYSWIETIKIAAQNLINPFAASLAMSGDFYSAIVDAAIQRARERGVK